MVDQIKTKINNSFKQSSVDVAKQSAKQIATSVSKAKSPESNLTSKNVNQNSGGGFGNTISESSDSVSFVTFLYVSLFLAWIALNKDQVIFFKFCFSKKFLGTFKGPIRRVLDGPGVHIVVVCMGLHVFFLYR